MSTHTSQHETRIESDHLMYLSPADELANTLTHGSGFLLSIMAMFFFWDASRPHELGLRITCVVFATSMALVYLFSTLSHVVSEPRRRYRLRAWDQGLIYVLITGTYSPFVWQGSPPGWTGPLLLAIWLAAALGFYSKVFSAYRVNAVSTITYVLLGWLPALPLIPRTPIECFVWMMLGGVSYTIGIGLLILSERVRFTHAGWHLMVMLGSLCHCIAIYRLLEIATPISER